MDPITLAALAIGTALAGGGAILGKGDQIKAAQRDAAARNAVLRDTLTKTDRNAADNRNIFNGVISGFNPGPQEAGLAASQNTRATNNASALTEGNANDIALSGSAPSVVRSEIAKKMLSAFQGATGRAKASGRLGGYNDQWLNNNIGVQNASGDIGTNNNFARGQYGILPNLQEFASTAAYKPPSIFPDLMKFAGNILGGAAGSGMFGSPARAASGINPGVAGGGYLGSGGQIFPGPGAPY